MVIGACIEVHRVLGPGLLESAYEACLAHELTLRGLSFERQKALPVSYNGVELECGYRMDFEVSAELVVEIRAETIRRGLRRLTLNPPNLPDLPPSCDHTQKSC